MQALASSGTNQTKGKYDAFISYSHESDATLATALGENLTRTCDSVEEAHERGASPGRSESGYTELLVRTVPRGGRLPGLVPSWVPLLTLPYRSLPSRERKSLIFLRVTAIS